MNLLESVSGTVTAAGSQECVGAPSWADVVQSTDGKEIEPAVAKDSCHIGDLRKSIFVSL
jgi:hypothetical protein